VAGPLPRTCLAPPTCRARTRTARRLPGILLAVLLALFGGSVAGPQQQQAHALATGGQSAGSYHQDPPQHLHGANAHPAHAATQAPLPLLPAAGRECPEPRRGFAPAEGPQVSAAHLTHRTPRHGRAPPAGTGI
jgi:hypothetical protein